MIKKYVEFITANKLDDMFGRSGIYYWAMLQLEIRSRYFHITDIPLLEGLIYD